MDTAEMPESAYTGDRLAECQASSSNFVHNTMHKSINLALDFPMLIATLSMAQNYQHQPHLVRGVLTREEIVLLHPMRILRN
jgi:hypothetical protein